MGPMPPSVSSVKGCSIYDVCKESGFAFGMNPSPYGFLTHCLLSLVSCIHIPREFMCLIRSIPLSCFVFFLLPPPHPLQASSMEPPQDRISGRSDEGLLGLTDRSTDGSIDCHCTADCTATPPPPLLSSPKSFLLDDSTNIRHRILRET